MKTNKNVLFISYDGMTDPLGQSQVLPYLTGLSEAGFNIYLLSCEKKEAFEKNKNTIKEIVKKYSIHWVPLTYTKSPPVISTLVDIIKLKKQARLIHQLYHIDMVHTRPGIPALIGLWMKNKFGVKFLNDIREFYADSRVDGGMWNLKNPLYRMIYAYFKRKENEAVEKNDGIVCLTNVAEKIITKWPSCKKPLPLHVIPCSADLELFDPDKIQDAEYGELKAQFGIKQQDIIFSYLGSIGGWYLTDELLQFCKLLSKKIPDAKFLFISPHRHEDIIAAAGRFGLSEQLIITTKATRIQVPKFLSLSHYSVFFIKPCYSKLSSSPTKHGEIMAMGIPVITNSGVGDVKEIVEQYNAGYVLDEFTNNAYNRVIDKIMDNSIIDKQQIRKGALEIYSLTKAVNSYKDIYTKILN